MGDPRMTTFNDSDNVTYVIDYIYARSYDDTMDHQMNWGSYISTDNILISNDSLGNASTSGTTVTLPANGANAFQIGDVIRIGGHGRRITAKPTSSTLTIESAFSSNFTNQQYWRGGAAPNTLYYLYVIGAGDGDNNVVLSTRCFAHTSLGQDLVDLPQGYTKFRQLWPVFITNQNGDGFVAFNYTKNKMISVYNPNDITASPLYQANGYYLNVNHYGGVGYLYSGFNLNLPKTMSKIYLQAGTRGTILTNGKFSMRDNTAVLYDKATVAIDSTSSTADFVFLGGIIDSLNVMGQD
jgi:hypothetical protein